MKSGPLLQLERVSVRYGAIEALREVSIEVGAGEIVTIIGANGAGKSSLLKSIAGLEPIASGRILIDGRDIGAIPAHKRLQCGVTLAPEGRGIFPDQSVLDNLLLGAYSLQATAAEINALVGHGFELFPRLAQRQAQWAGTLSGGEQQMLALARALMSKPRLLLLDEPSLGLAPLVIRDILRSIRVLRDAGLTILLVEQMAHQALALADRGYVLETGRITLEGSGSALLANPGIRAFYLGAH
ncbi:ABC transporter ATP-binding protein [Verminephrobacter eiseniae]|uniref:ABC transporter related n=1 Tax=Verminephrobacter eiseniae (strain EF01-2) TaxID=391735 RepID=A1WEM2_VEREI|nr:ABC transporter ATP-binding protein [Verminephrobacter eiseniae]ABM56079.1 ABC transporter related [Verminephrobacter eiseniae EF01-2]MCW5233116.1 ABC transporter ATP-binding protein [Verminephrobacter eiseniae]MCW5261278.1 ABC transporter ATP-binding protein [Verminephrobacter eiseniae]MCW5286452.1 ABC transporter ATP-binding protein [Verminephrobacter eiseniae]MCW5295329.1 ABC transporter ATP-binding protein [Verminephrobacter eiseniae]